MPGTIWRRDTPLFIPRSFVSLFSIQRRRRLLYSSSSCFSPKFRITRDPRMCYDDGLVYGKCGWSIDFGERPGAWEGQRGEPPIALFMIPWRRCIYHFSTGHRSFDFSYVPAILFTPGFAHSILCFWHSAFSRLPGDRLFRLFRIDWEILLVSSSEAGREKIWMEY